MSQDNKEKVEKTKSQMMKISLVSLLVVLLFMIEIYEIINDPANLIVIGSLGVFLLVSVYVEVLFIGKLSEKRVQDQEEAFDNVYRSEKASYLLMRKYFDQMEQKMENLGDISKIPYKELIAAQKALAKAQINRNKQNTNALLISNDRMMQRLNSMQNDIADILAHADNNTNITEISHGLTEQDKEVFIEGNKNVLDKQQEILYNIKELESSLRNEILESANKVASMKSQQISVPQPQMQENEDMIPPLDIEEDFSFADNYNSDEKQNIEKSSESTLDQLLQQINAADSLEPELQPIVEEAELQPIIDEPELQPVMEEAGLQSIVDEPELQPIVEEAELQPIIDEPELQPIIEEAELQPIIDEPELQPVMEEAELQPIIDEPELQPVMEEAELQPIVDEPELQPVMEEAELQPIIDEPELQPVMEEAELQPIIDEPEFQPVMDEPELQPITEELGFQPIIEEAEPQPVLEDDLQLIAEETEPQPVMEESELQSNVIEPVIEESELLQTAEPELQPQVETFESLAEPEEAQPVLEQPELVPMPELSEMNVNTAEPKLQPVIDKQTSDINDTKLQLKSIAEQFQPSRAAMKSSLGGSVKQKKPFVQPKESGSNDDELEKIMKAMDIDDISGDSLEDIDIDKILEVPLSNEKQSTADSGQVMSSEEIAALIANTELLSEPETGKNDNMVDLSDPRHVMSSEEIAALIANM